MLNLALPKTLVQKKAVVVYKPKKTSTKVLKAKTPITLPKTPKKTSIKAPAKAVVVEKVKEVVIY